MGTFSSVEAVLKWDKVSELCVVFTQLSLFIIKRFLYDIGRYPHFSPYNGNSDCFFFFPFTIEHVEPLTCAMKR